MARHFDGVDDRIDIGTVQGPQSAFSCSVWVYPSTVVGALLIFALYDSSLNQGYCQFFRNGSNLNARLEGSSANYIGRIATGIFTANKWHHVCMTWSGGTTAASIKVYVNGIQKDDTNDNAGTFSAPSTNSNPRTIGAQFTGTYGNFWSGDIAHLQLFNRELTIGEVNSTMGIPGSIRKGLIEYYPLWGGTREGSYVSGGIFGTVQNGTTSVTNNPPINAITKKKRSSLNYATMFPVSAGGAVIDTGASNDLFSYVFTG